MQVSNEVEIRRRRAGEILSKGAAALIAGSGGRATDEAVTAFRARFSRRSEMLARALSTAWEDGRDDMIAKCRRMGELAAEIAANAGRPHVLASDLEQAWASPVFFTRNCPLVPTQDPDKDDVPDAGLVLPL